MFLFLPCTSIVLFNFLCSRFYLTKFNKENKCLLSLEFHSRSLYYKLAVEQLQSHPEAQEALGPPLNIHYLKLTDRENFVDIADAKVTCFPCELQASAC